MKKFAKIVAAKSGGKIKVNLFYNGTLGSDQFDRFFESFGFRLALEHGGKRAARPVGPTTRVLGMDQFCRQQVRC
jgi:hypothetical protein